MDNQAGKRVAKPDKGPGGGKTALIVIAVLAALLAAGYVGLCAYVSGGGKLLPNTTAAGIELGGMTRDQAAAALSAQVEERLAALSVEFICEGTRYTVSGSEVDADCQAAVDAAFSAQDGGFFTGGFRFLSALTGARQNSVPVRFSQDLPEAIEQARAASSSAEHATTWTREGDRLVFHKGRTGRALDTEVLSAAVLERFSHLLVTGDSASNMPLEAPVTTAPPEEPDFQAIYDELFVAPADAYLDAATKEIVPSVTGVRFSVEGAAAKLADTPEGGACTIALTLEEPELTTEQLEERLFADLLAETSTKCAGPSGRWYNIDLACSFVNGTILLPGEVFSYTDLCGPYEAATGYKKAGAYVQGKTVDTTAGGICQLSSTLYWATLVANLETVERAQHAYNTGYLPIVGTDATVYGSSPDFKFKNSTDYPIKIECYQDKSHRLYVKLYGTDTTGIHGEPYSVLISTKPAETVYEAKADQPLGTTSKDPERTAYNGRTVEVYLNLVDKDGNVVETKFLHKDTYRARNGVIFYNPADAEALGIDPATGKRTEVPASASPSPAPSPSTEPTPAATESPVASPSPEPSPSVEPSPEPAPSTEPTPGTEPSPSAEPSPEPVPTSGPGMEPEDETSPAPDLPQA